MPTIGVQMMMLKTQVEEVGAHEVLRRLDGAGFHAVEISQIPMTATNVAEIRRAQDDFGVDVGAISAQIDSGGLNDSLSTDYAKVVADARALRASRVRIGMLPVAAIVDAQALLAFCREAEAISQHLARGASGAARRRCVGLPPRVPGPGRVRRGGGGEPGVG